jgi:hypothetical protein
MLLDGQWCRDGDDEPETLKLKLGDFFLGMVKRGQGDDAKYWIAHLNGQRLNGHEDIEWAKGRVEEEICTKLHNIREAFRLIKRRAPTGSDLFGDGVWERFKAARNQAASG